MATLQDWKDGWLVKGTPDTGGLADGDSVIYGNSKVWRKDKNGEYSALGNRNPQ